MGESKAQKRANERYYEAQRNYEQAIENYRQTATDAYNQAYENSKKNVGQEGFKRSYDMAKDRADAIAQARTSQAMANAQMGARLAGTSKAKAAQMASQQGAQNYITAHNQELSNQQQLAQSALNNENTNEYNRASGVSGTEGNVMSGAGSVYSGAAQNAQNAYAREEGNVGGVFHKIISGWA